MNEMAYYKNFVKNSLFSYLIVMPIFAVAWLLSLLVQLEFAIMASALILYLPLRAAQTRFLPGRRHLVRAIAALGFCVGVLALFEPNDAGQLQWPFSFALSVAVFVVLIGYFAVSLLICQSPQLEAES